MKRLTAEEIAKRDELAALGAQIVGPDFLARIGDYARGGDEHVEYLRRRIADLQAAANCAWALLPAAQRVQMYTTYPRLAELAADGYVSAEDAQTQAIREATEEASR
jgi:hypothetical protein